MSDNGFDLGNARGYVEIDSSGVKRGMDEARRHWDAGLSSMLSGVDRIGGAMQSLGTQMTAIGAPFAAGMGVAVKSAIDFDESMTNVGAILGKTRDEMTQLNAEILEIGAASRAGPQGAADAFAEIAGGVADASIHMAILNSAVATAEAGNANLQGVTAALVSTMNSYSFAAEDAGMASDVLTQTVGMGVGSMDELAAALPQVTGLAKSTGVAFDDLGAMMALLSTRGNSFGQSATQIRAIMVAMLNPNEKMKKAFEEIGVASGEAAIEQYGLAGALKLLNEESPTFQANMAGTLGSVEALNGSIALMSDGTEEFIGQFTDGLEGATDAARELQNASPAAAMDRLMSRFAALKIELGKALVPVLERVLEALEPIITQLTGWIQQNPELIAGIGMLVGGMVTLGPIIAGVGAAISMLASPIGIVIAAVAALGAAFATNFMGIRDAVQPFFDALQNGWAMVLPVLEQIRAWFIDEAMPAISSLITQSVIPAVESFTGTLAQIWAIVAPHLTALYDWFVNTALPAILGFVSGTVIPGVQGFIDVLRKVWEDVSPFLVSLFDWFMNSALPVVLDFINNVAVPAVQGFIDILMSIWDSVSPILGQLYDWFITNGLPFVQTAIEAVTTLVQGFVDVLAKIWTSVQPGIDAFKNGIEIAFNWVRDHVITPLLTALTDLLNWANNVLVQLGLVKSEATDVNAIASNALTGDGTGISYGGVTAPGFDTGGFTGFGPPGAIAGFVHAEEYVIPAQGVPVLRENGSRSAMEFGPGAVVIHANSYEQGRAAADGFTQRMDELRRSRG